MMIGWRRGAGWLPGLLIFFLALGLAGCAGPSQVVVPPPQPAPTRPPVRVSTSPPRLERKDTSRKEAQAKADAQAKAEAEAKVKAEAEAEAGKSKSRRRELVTA